MIEYKRPCENDVDELANLWLKLGEEDGKFENANIEWWKELYNTLICSENYVAVKATDGDKTIGFMDGFVMKNPATGKIHGIGQHLYLLSDYRNTNIAGKIYRKMFKIARSMGATVFDIFQQKDDDKWIGKHFKPVYTLVRKEFDA